MPYIRAKRPRGTQLPPLSGFPPFNKNVPRPVLVWTPALRDPISGEDYTRVATGTADVPANIDVGATRLFKAGTSYVLPLTTVPYFPPPATVLAVFRADTAANNAFFSFGGSGVGGGWVFRATNINQLSVTYGGIADYPLTTSSVRLGQTHCVAGAIGGGSWDGYVNGQYQGTRATAAGDPNVPTHRATVAGANEAFGAGCHIALVVVWDEKLPGGTLARLTENPQRLWAPYRRPIYFASAGGTEYTITPSGGMTFGGSATLIRGRVFPAAGGVAFSGAAALETHNVERIITPSGGVVFGGTATLTFTGNDEFVITPSGGVSFGGGARLIRGKVLGPASGGLAFGGTAPLETHNVERVYSPSGGVLFGGTAVIEFTSGEAVLVSLIPMYYRRRSRR
jgi:hypothetical protein